MNAWAASALARGRMNEALQLLTAAPKLRYLGYDVWARWTSGRRPRTLAAISPDALQQVLVYAGLGDKDGALKALDRMAELGPVRSEELSGSPNWLSSAVIRASEICGTVSTCRISSWNRCYSAGVLRRGWASRL